MARGWWGRKEEEGKYKRPIYKMESAMVTKPELMAFTAPAFEQSISKAASGATWRCQQTNSENDDFFEIRGQIEEAFPHLWVIFPMATNFWGGQDGAQK